MKKDKKISIKELKDILKEMKRVAKREGKEFKIFNALNSIRGNKK